MNEQDEYELKIGAYSPHTIPMERLAEYMAAFAKLLGNPAGVHFSEVKFGSTVLVALADREATQKVFERVNGVYRGEAANEANEAYTQIDALARKDGGDAVLIRRAAFTRAQSQILVFPGVKRAAVEVFGPISQATTIDGELVRLGGRDGSAHASIYTADGIAQTAWMMRELGEQLKGLLWHQLRFHGTGKWERREDEKWHLKDFKITSFEELADETLLDVTNKLRSLQPSGWAEVADIDGVIRGERGDSLH